MYEQNTATAAPAADAGGFFSKRGARPTVGYAAPAPLPPVQHAPLSPMEAVPAAPAAVTSAPAPLNFAAAPQAFGTEAPLHPGFVEAPNHAGFQEASGFQEVSPTFAATSAEPAPYSQAPIYPEEQAQTFAATPQPEAILSNIPSFDQAPFPAENPVTVPDYETAAPAASTYSPPSFSAAFGNGAPEIPQAISGAEYAHAPAYEGPLEPLPAQEAAPQAPVAFVQQPEDLSGPEKLAAIPPEVRPELGIAPDATFESLTPEHKELIESTPAFAPQATEAAPDIHPAVQTVLDVLNGEVVAGLDGSVRLHAAAFKVMLEKSDTPEGQSALNTQGFKELEKVAHGLPAGSSELNKLLDGATELLRAEIITPTNQLEIARVGALSDIADGTIGSAKAAIIQAQRGEPQRATPPQQGEPQPGKFTATVTQGREQSGGKEQTPGYL